MIQANQLINEKIEKCIQIKLLSKVNFTQCELNRLYFYYKPTDWFVKKVLHKAWIQYVDKEEYINKQKRIYNNRKSIKTYTHAL